MLARSFAIADSRSYDVIVVGGGTTGIAAAIAAARSGAHTALVEYYGFLGGTSATGLPWLGFHNLSGELVVGGIALECVKRMREVGGATDFYLDPICGSVVGINPHWWKLIAMEEVQRAGVEVHLHSLVADVETETTGALPRAVAVYAQSKGGLRRLEASALIDCTDSGDVARTAGVNMVRGRDTDNKVQVSSWPVAIGGVDFDRLMAYFRAHPDDMRPFPIDEERMASLLDQMERAEVFVMGAFRSLIQQARRDGLELPRDVVPAVGFPPVGEVMTVASRVEDVDPNDPASFTRAEQEGMRQTHLWLRFFRGYVPGFENCRLVGTPHQIGIRETLHMEGEYTLTADDLLSGRLFDDVVALGAYHLDIHSPDHSGLETKTPPTYQIPFRCLVPRHVDGLVVAGRAISATHEAMSSTRVIPIGMAQGQAAGMAASLGLAQKVPLRDIDVRTLQARLIADGAILAVDRGCQARLGPAIRS